MFLSDYKTWEHQPIQLVSTLQSTEEKEERCLVEVADSRETTSGHSAEECHPAGGIGEVQHDTCRSNQENEATCSSCYALYCTTSCMKDMSLRSYY